MRLRKAVWLTLPLLLWTGTARAQQVKDPAELMPAGTVLYVEVRQPGALAKEVAALFEGSPLGNVPDSLARLPGGGSPSSRGTAETAGIFGVMISPEVVREVGRIRGAAVAFTGMSKEEPGMPEFVAVVLPGDSNAPGFLMRTFLASFRSGYSNSDGRMRTEEWHGFEKVQEVEGVGLYREVRHRVTTPIGGGAAGQPPAGKQETTTHGPAVAMTPDALFVGSTNLVADAVRRAKGKGQGRALASVPAYREASEELGHKPGLFFYGDPAGAMALIDQAPLPPDAKQGLGIIKNLLNPKAIRSAAASVTLENGVLVSRKIYRLNPEERSPVLELLPTTPLKKELLSFAPRDTLFCAALANGGGEKRWQQLLEQADALAKIMGPGGPMPSELAGHVEGMLGVKFGKDVLGKVEGVAVALAGPERFSKAIGRPGAGVPPLVVIVQTTDGPAAESLAKDVLPKAFALMANNPDLKPVTERVAGQSISVYQLPGAGTVCYGRQGATIVLGTDRDLVGEALDGGAKKGGLLADEKFAAAVRGLGEPVALVTVRPAALASIFVLTQTSSPVKSSARPIDSPRAVPVPPPPPPAPPPPQQAGARHAEILNLLKNEEPLVIGVTRKPDRLAIEARYGGLRKMVPMLLDVLMSDYGHATATPVKPDARPAPPPPPR